MENVPVAAMNLAMEIANKAKAGFSKTIFT